MATFTVNSEAQPCGGESHPRPRAQQHKALYASLVITKVNDTRCSSAVCSSCIFIHIWSLNKCLGDDCSLCLIRSTIFSRKGQRNFLPLPYQVRQTCPRMKRAAVTVPHSPVIDEPRKRTTLAMLNSYMHDACSFKLPCTPFHRA